MPFRLGCGSIGLLKLCLVAERAGIVRGVPPLAMFPGILKGNVLRVPAIIALARSRLAAIGPPVVRLPPCSIKTIVIFCHSLCSFICAWRGLAGQFQAVFLEDST